MTTSAAAEIMSAFPGIQISSDNLAKIDAILARHNALGVALGLEMAARLIEQKQQTYSSGDGRILTDRRHYNMDGIAYAAAIRSLSPTIPAGLVEKMAKALRIAIAGHAAYEDADPASAYHIRLVRAVLSAAGIGGE